MLSHPAMLLTLWRSLLPRPGPWLPSLRLQEVLNVNVDTALFIWD